MGKRITQPSLVVMRTGSGKSYCIFVWGTEIENFLVSESGRDTKGEEGADGHHEPEGVFHVCLGKEI